MRDEVECVLLEHFEESLLVRLLFHELNHAETDEVTVLGLHDVVEFLAVEEDVEDTVALGFITVLHAGLYGT